VKLETAVSRTNHCVAAVGHVASCAQSAHDSFPFSFIVDVHLTNVAIQKKGDDYDAESGGKWDVRSLKLYLLSKYGVERVNALFYSIQLLCIRSLLAVQKVIISDRHSFEMYGYDVLIDADLKVSHN
jgi:hypothetical protein